MGRIFCVCRLGRHNFSVPAEASCFYHNIPCPHLSGRVQRECGVSPAKPTVNHPANRAFCA